MLQLAASWGTLLAGRLDAVYATSDHLPPIKNREVREKAEQDRLQKTEDWKEGTRAMAERRNPAFRGR